jgi:alpha-ribazole phosphatase
MKPERTLSGRTRVYLIRHGQVTNHASGVYNGRTDVGITEQGREQMNALRDRLVGKKIAALYCSGLARTREGALIIGEGLGLSYKVFPDLQERAFGDWEGLTYEGIRENYPDLFAAWRDDVTSVRPPGGENLYDVSERVMKVYLPLIERHRGEEIVIVAHGGVNRVILAHALKMEIRRIFRIDQEYGCLNMIDYYDDGFAHVKLMNGLPLAAL